jgi:phosphatidylinositol phospholipase C delta
MNDNDMSQRDEGSTLEWHLGSPSMLDRTANMVGLSKFARGTLSKAVSTNYMVDTSAWTQNVVFPATYVETVLQQVPVTERLLKGIRVTKVTTYGKFKPRVLTISQDRFALFCTHHKVRKKSKGGVLSTVARTLPLPLISRKGIRGFSNDDLRDLYVRYLDITDIDCIDVGYPCTRKLEVARGRNRLSGFDDRIDEFRDQIVSISHHGGQTLDVFIPNVNDRKLLVSTLLSLREKYHSSKVYVVNEARLLRYIWYDVDRNHDGSISEKEFELVVNRINLHVVAPRKVYRIYRKEHDITSALTYGQCVTLLHSIREGKYAPVTSMHLTLPSIPGTQSHSPCSVHMLPHLSLWNALFGADQDYVTAKDFLAKFLHPCQKEMDANVQDVKALFTSINRMEVNLEETLPTRKNCLSRLRFRCYLHHVINMAFDPDETELNPELMKRPLTEYWINSSHNTYLVGDQLQSTSSVEMYMKALHRGCVCLELDCWDGERNAKTGEPIPIVYHGGTLTGKILFEDVIGCVENYVTAHPDTYPIILSLENHCSDAYQKVMVKLMKKILKGKIYMPFADGSKEHLGEDDPLPSPLDLKGRVLIKGKRHCQHPPIDGCVSKESHNDDEGDEDEDEMDGEDMVVNRLGDGHAGAGVTKSRGISKEKTIVELAQMTLLHGGKYKNWESSLATPPNHMHSVSETKITKLVNKGGATEWRLYNGTHMTRTYPAGTRVDSSNYNPILAWSMGCQIVALNFQAADSPLFLNDGRFRQNGQCGYVLKPQDLSRGPRKKPITLKVRILCGSCIPKPKGAKTGESIDPYVQITVHDVVNSKENKEVFKATTKTSETVYDNGFSPMWNEEEFHEFKVYSPFVAMIQFSVWETDVGLDDKVADSAIPITCLRKGYRSILLHDESGTRTGPFGFATLLAEIQLKE